MARIAVGIITFNGMPFLEGVIESIYDYADQIIVVEGPVNYWQGQGYECSTDGTLEFLDHFPDCDGKMTILKGQWGEKEEMCNAYMEHIRDDITHTWHMDDDEFYPVSTIECVLMALDGYDVVGFHRRTFVGDFYHYYKHPGEASVVRIHRHYPGARYYSHRPLSVLCPENGQRWHYTGRYLRALGQMFHYSLVLPHQQERKARYYQGQWGSSWLPPNLHVERYGGPHPWWIEENMGYILEEHGSS